MKRFYYFLILLFFSCSHQPAMEVEDTGDALILKNHGLPVLQYNYSYVAPPEGVDSIFGKSGFLHPVWDPAGNMLTSIQPVDHRHHYGIWNPWTRILYDSVRYDLWNLGDRQGAVRARSIDSVFQGDTAGFVATLDHIIFNPDGEKVIMVETWKVCTWDSPDGFIWEFESTLQPSTDLPVVLEKYRYAGFGYRATPQWTRENSSMLTSEGLARQEINATRAKWIYAEGEMPTGSSGILFMAHPQNHNSPESLRIWDEDANNGRGDVFINFNPVQTEDWTLEPGHTYTLIYRVLAFNGKMNKNKAEKLWKSFQN
jgi:hypothetical protein